MDRQFYEQIKHILETARQKAYTAANSAMVEAYWNIGRHIVERQGGEDRAEYGSGLIKELSAQMTKDFGKGFTIANLKNMRQFYLTFPNGYALRSELSWSHYRLLMRVENERARSFYLDECVKSRWSTRQLGRQISTLFYERLLSSKDKAGVASEIKKLEDELKMLHSSEIPFEQITREAVNQYPAIVSLFVARGAEVAVSDFDRHDGLLAVVKTSAPLDESEKSRLTNWLKIRLNTQNVTLYEFKAEPQKDDPDEK